MTDSLIINGLQSSFGTRKVSKKEDFFIFDFIMKNIKQKIKYNKNFSKF